MCIVFRKDKKMRITKAAIQALATQKVKDQFAAVTDKMIYLDSVINDSGFELSLTDRPVQWDRCIEWLEDAL
mgnify:CR=1 FL=1|jgi:hypothetical protein|tara:strand:+ start:1465 stop:1680 length:216 start_codon:yes stop_codon:yes gene_type:complete